MKISIIEDRIGRLEQYADFDLKSYKSVSIITGSEFDTLVNSLKINDTSILDQFECIASHRSAFSTEVRDTLKDYCRSKRKPLIFFSGGITSSVIKDVEFPFLHINSRDFYSENLKLFIEKFEENSNINLLVLQFGRKWKLSLLLNLRNYLAVAINKQVIKTQIPNAQIDESEIIKRVRDLKINEVIKSDLLNEKTEKTLSGNEFNLVSIDEIKQIKQILDRLILEIA